MKFKFLSLILAFAFTFAINSEALERQYVSGDGGMDYTCQADVGENEVLNVFSFHLMYDANSGKSGFDLISDENLKSGNGDLIYRVAITQTAEGIPTEPRTLPLPGCQESIIIVEQKSETRFETYFECDADGDAGYGTLVLDTTALTITGEIHFPEGQSQLPYPIQDNTTFQLTCQ